MRIDKRSSSSSTNLDTAYTLAHDSGSINWMYECDYIYIGFCTSYYSCLITSKSRARHFLGKSRDLYSLRFTDRVWIRRCHSHSGICSMYSTETVFYAIILYSINIIVRENSISRDLRFFNNPKSLLFSYPMNGYSLLRVIISISNRIHSTIILVTIYI